MISNDQELKPKSRIERWRLRLQGCNFKVNFIEGEKNLADYISRHVGSIRVTKQSEYAKEYVRYISENAVPKKHVTGWNM